MLKVKFFLNTRLAKVRLNQWRHPCLKYKNINKWAGIVSELFGKYSIPVEASILASNHAQKRQLTLLRQQQSKIKESKLLLNQAQHQTLIQLNIKL